MKAKSPTTPPNPKPRPAKTMSTKPRVVDKHCPFCGSGMLEIKTPRPNPFENNRILFQCPDFKCGHSYKKETSREIMIRIGRYDRYFGILHLTTEGIIKP